MCKNRVKLILRLKLVPSDNFDLSEIKNSIEVDCKNNVSFEEIVSQSKKCFAAVSLSGYCPKLVYPLTKYYEYMAESLPIIELGGCPNEFLKTLMNNDNHPLGLVVDSDPQTIANAIDYLYENKEVARTMGMNGRKAFETKYNFESEADGFLKFLEEVSQSKSSNK
jgi:glycosyltransferase involved in cell wall biosynthesis